MIKKNRRNFIKKTSALVSGTLMVSASVFSRNNPTNMNESFINNIRPLGFQWYARDPFLFCVHHDDKFPKGNANMGPDPSLLKGRQIGQDFNLKDGWRMYHGETVPGFPSHPHRGFETVTVVRKGIVDHTDSMKASGRYGNGDVQWMTAGKGIQHAEMFPLVNQHEGNPMELFQIWLNLPKANKFVNPYFKMLWSESIPNYIYTNNSGNKTIVEIIAGSIDNFFAPSPPPDSWAAKKKNEIAIWNIKMETNSKWTLPKASKGINRTIYFYKGEQLQIEDITLEKYHSAELNPEAELTLHCKTDNCYILILQGRPINEPVVQHGPFVMNTQAEIKETFNDYRETQFGGWPWPVNDPVHEINKGRFAIHSDGRHETP